MKIRKANTWNEVKEAFQVIVQERDELVRINSNSYDSSEFLFRGHSNSDWKLDTTLERVTREPVPVTEYYRHVLKTQPQVEAFSDSQWSLMGLQEYTEWAKLRSDLSWPDFPGYEYMIYLRHHGFPSPLLDWTRSFYVAAYFAYSSLPNDNENIAIYCYSETIGLGKHWCGSEPMITVRGPYVRSHKRHFLQQCKYTVCSKQVEGTLYYENHEEVFKSDNPEQDLLWKIIVPRSSASEALKDLDSMNVNALSLMGSEDALIETLGAREYLF